MAENITSLLVKDELAAADALTTDVIYIVHGTGTPRDKKMTVAELRKLIGGNAGDITVNSITFTDGTNTYTVELSQDGRIIFNTGISTDNDVVVKGEAVYGFDTVMSALGTIKGLLFKAGNSRDIRAYVTYNAKGRKIVIHGDGTNGNEAIVLDGDTLVSSGKSIIGNVRTDSISPQHPGSNVNVDARLSALNVPVDFVSVDNVSQASAEATLADSKELLDTGSNDEYWKVGQVKRFRNSLNADRTIYLLGDGGGSYAVTVPQRTYITLCCTGTVTLSGTKYAVVTRGA